MFLDCILERNANQAYDTFLEALKTDYLPVFTLIKNAECHPPTGVQEVDCQETLVLGNFPKLPPYYIERTARVSFIIFVVLNQEGGLVVSLNCFYF